MVFADAHADPPGLTALEVTSTRRRILGVAYLDRYKATGVIQIISNQTLTFVSQSRLRSLYHIAKKAILISFLQGMSLAAQPQSLKNDFLQT